MSQHWVTVKEAGALNGMRIMVWVHSIFGRPVFGIVLVPVMIYFFIRRGTSRRASMDYLRRVKRCYPESLGGRSLTWLSFRHYLAFGHSLLDKYLAWAQTPAGIAMDPEEEKILLEVEASGKGCLIIGSHFGNLEYSRGIAIRHPGLVINVLMYDQHAEKFNALMKESESESRMNLIQVTDLDFELALQLREKVQRGEWVVIAGDRVPVGENKRICRAMFFGNKANFPVGPYVLASLLHCPVYLLHCFRIEEHYRLVIEFFEDEIRLQGKNKQQVYERAAQKFAQALEKQVAQSPLQWFNFYDFWDNKDSESLKADSPEQL
jgi:predicted LPLAT superfamily acyltransferase